MSASLTPKLLFKGAVLNVEKLLLNDRRFGGVAP